MTKTRHHENLEKTKIKYKGLHFLAAVFYSLAPQIFLV